MLLKSVKNQLVASLFGALLLGVTSSASAMEATYDPIEAVVALAIVNSGNLSALDVAVMRDVSFKGLYSTGGFIDYMKRVRRVSNAQLNTYRSNIAAEFGRASLRHSGFMKVSSAPTDHAIQSYTSSGQAFGTLISAADGVFPRAYVIEALNAMHSAMNSSLVPELASSVR